MYVAVDDVNDNAPLFEAKNYGFSLTEDTAPGSVVATITATDLDLKENAKLVYHIVNTPRSKITLLTAFIIC